MPLKPESPESREPTERMPIRPRQAADDHGDQPDGASVLGLMAKFWMPGKAKTRLGRSIGMAPAAALHRLFTTHLCKNLCRSAERRELCLSPATRIPEAEATLAETNGGGHWHCVPQGDGDLGRRMTRWMTRHLSRPHSRSILIGADCPTLADHDIQLAIDLLDRHDVVLGPAIDGGYYLIGLRGNWDDRRRSLFQSIPWSGPEVLERTVERVVASELSLARLPPAEDIDTVLELNQLIDRLGNSNSPRDSELLGEIELVLRSTSPHPDAQPNG